MAIPAVFERRLSVAVVRARRADPAPKDRSLATIVQRIRLFGDASAFGTWIIATNRKSMRASNDADNRSHTLKMMLSEAAISATPTRYVQNSRPGIQLGTPFMIALADDRCSAPKTAIGTAIETAANQ